MSIIKTDMAKAKEVHKTNIRLARKDKLAELDIEFQKALETLFPPTASAAIISVSTIPSGKPPTETPVIVPVPLIAIGII